MSKFYYNGVLLPEIPQVADRPYTLIYQVQGNEYLPDGYYVGYWSSPYLHQNNSAFGEIIAVNVDARIGIIYYLAEVDGYYQQQYTDDGSEFFSSLEGVVIIDGTATPIWSNHDINTVAENEELTVLGTYMSASDPIPEGGASETLILVPESQLIQLADSIRAKAGLTEDMSVEEMIVAAGGIKTEPNLQNKTITENGTYSADSGYDALGSVTVEVASSGGSDRYIEISLGGATSITIL